jgi:hypothetical protein
MADPMWPGAEVPPEQARDWIRARMPPSPPDEPKRLPDGRRHLGPCAACGRGVYGRDRRAVCFEYGFVWHDRCAEDYPFPGRSAY